MIIGAGCVVTKDISDNSIFAGNPTKMISSFEKYYNKLE